MKKINIIFKFKKIIFKHELYTIQIYSISQNFPYIYKNILLDLQ